jgi:hypothetical protein
MAEAEMRRRAAGIIAEALVELKKQAELNGLSYLANLLDRALEEAREQASE